MRTIWNGSINFGLVNIPIGLAVAQQRKDTAFRTLHRECGTPIKQKRYCPFHERDVEADELVKGWEFSKGQFVLIEDSDLEAVALQRSQSVDIIRFVPIDQVDPIYFDRTYYLAPAGPEAQRRPYVLLLRAMQDAGMAAVGKFVLWGKENLCLIRPLGESLVLETLFFAEDIRPRKEIDEAVEETDVKGPELAMATQLVESLVGDFDPADYENQYRTICARCWRRSSRARRSRHPSPLRRLPWSISWRRSSRASRRRSRARTSLPPRRSPPPAARRLRRAS
jgi:DNA end-binding protein Ku